MSQMQHTFDLSIILSQPQADLSPETLAFITLTCDALGLSHTGEVLADPLTQRDRDDLHWYLEEYWKWPYLEFATRGSRVEASLVVVGQRLYNSVFGSEASQTLFQRWQQQRDGPLQMHIVSDIPRVLSLPWELLHDTHDFLALRSNAPVSIVRCLSQGEQTARLTSFEPPLRILLVTARPQGVGFIDPRSIARELVDEVQSQVETGTIDLEFLRPPTFIALYERLRDKQHPVHIFHFDGHGTFDETQKQGVLLFETETGRPSQVRGSDLAKVLRDSGIQLAVLTACQSAQGAEEDAFSSVSAQLLHNDLDTVVAMSASVLVASATRYVEAFYRALAEGVPVSVIQQRARKALYDDPHRHPHRRYRDDAGKPINLSDWWLPHLYQQRPVVLQPTMHGSIHQGVQLPPPRYLAEDMPSAPRYGFTGRAQELLQIERCLFRRNLVVLHGFGGVGKTALAREVAEWLTRTRLYQSACFVSFEGGGDAMTLLSTLGHFLDVYDASYRPDNSSSALARLAPVLQTQKILVVLDNLESILSGGKTALAQPTRTELWDVLFALKDMGVGVILTSRDTAFSDMRLEPGNTVMYMELEGLLPDDASALAARVLEQLNIQYKHIPYAALSDLLSQLNYLPLAIQLVLPLLETLPLTTIQSEFARLLEQFVDKSESGRNASLLASLEYSLTRLTSEQRSLLSRLALFEGGAIEAVLLEIIGVSQDEWGTLRAVLERGALLTVELFVPKLPFLRIHPVLAPYIRSRLWIDDQPLRENYIQRYCELAELLAHEDDSNPLPVRALMRQELPNMHRVLDLLLEEGKVETASIMAYNISRFLDDFGLWRERDALQQRLAAAMKVTGKGVKEALTYEEYLHERSLGREELERGDPHVAYARFAALQQRIDALPPDSEMRYRSAPLKTKVDLARCLIRIGQPALAEEQLRAVLMTIDRVDSIQPLNETSIDLRGDLMRALGDALSEQWKYEQAKQAYEEALSLAKQRGNMRDQAICLQSLATWAVNVAPNMAKPYLTSALHIIRSLNEPMQEAHLLHMLGMVAAAQQAREEAEQYFRESLALNERVGDISGISSTCNELALLARETGDSALAEGWFKRALEFDERVHPGSLTHAKHLQNLAFLLLEEVAEYRLPEERLAEARAYAERALNIGKMLDKPQEYSLIIILGVLADIAKLEGRVDAERAYQHSMIEIAINDTLEHEVVDRMHGQLIATIAFAAKGNIQAQMQVDSLPNSQPIEEAIHRIWAGERDWTVLVDHLLLPEAMIVRRVLELLVNDTQQYKTPEQVLASIPTAISEAKEWNQAIAEQIDASLSSEERLTIMEIMDYRDNLVQKNVERFEPLSQAIARVAFGDNTEQGEIEATLMHLEGEGLHLEEMVHRLWAGEYDVKILTDGQGVMEAVILVRILEIIGENQEEKSAGG